MIDSKKMEPYLPKLKEKFGFNSFRDGQFQIIQTLLEEKRDVCGILATGQGKSLCYQFPAVYTGKTSIVVSPLISLMQDQKMALLAKKIPCETLSGQTRNYLDTVSAVVRGEFMVVYTTPEFIHGNTGILKKMEAAGTLGLLAIDEAHCISQWGHDFRPSFRKLTQLRQSVDEVPILTLTATATPTIVQDICDSLNMKNPRVVQTPIYRPNLSIWVKKKGSSSTMPEIREILGKPSLYYKTGDKTKKDDSEAEPEPKKLSFKKNGSLPEDEGCLMDSSDDESLEVRIVDSDEETESPQAAGREDSVIIYTQSRKDAEKICAVLKKAGYPVEYYHAGLSDWKRQEVHENFIYDRTPIVVATIAFGMGIDKPSIRKIINWGMPANLETYYQEIGRAGRDGLDSSCYMFQSGGDLMIHKFLIGKMTAPKEVQEHHLHLLNVMRQWTTSEVCRQYQIAQYFEKEQLVLQSPSEEEQKKFCGICDNCVARATGENQDDEKVNIAKEAKLMVGLVKGTSINYGFKNLVGVLTGSKAKDFPARLKMHAMYGDGDYHSQAFWRALGDLLIDHGYLKYTKVGGMFGRGNKGKVFQVVTVGDKKLELDKNRELWVVPNSGLRTHMKSKKTAHASTDVTPLSGELMIKLKALRRQMSERMNLPPYLVLSDPVINSLLKLRSGTNRKIDMMDLTTVDGMNAQVLMEFGTELQNVMNS